MVTECWPSQMASNRATEGGKLKDADHPKPSFWYHGSALTDDLLTPALYLVPTVSIDQGPTDTTDSTVM